MILLEGKTMAIKDPLVRKISDDLDRFRDYCRYEGKVFKEAKSKKYKPTVIIAHTIKGKGVSYMENSPSWHGSLKLSDEDITHALLELGATEAEIKGYINE